ncbi:putative ABC transporter permease [Caproiciproducens sp. R1]|uniref:putative ABC transporter permease n=1 Tax=Caproiciproducens sp. R1 TaxID=3435000 RepID=UPI00403442B8
MLCKVRNFLLKDALLLVIGGDIYLIMEICYRGYSHWSMFILGGVCFLGLGYINRFLSWETPLVLQMLIGMLLITALELITGMIVNVHFGWEVWDYSQKPFNLFGQICLSSSIGWYFLSAVGIVLDDYLRCWIFEEEQPRYYLFHKKLKTRSRFHGKT